MNANNHTSASGEYVIREYPNLTYWMEGGKIKGEGNLILTSERLIFLNRVELEDWQAEKAQQISSEGNFDKIIEFALKLDKRNFHVPISSITSTRMGMCSFALFVKLCMRVSYMTPKGNPLEARFWFKIPLLKSLSQTEITLVMGWIYAIKSAIKKKRKAAGY